MTFSKARLSVLGGLLALATVHCTSEQGDGAGTDMASGDMAAADSSGMTPIASAGGASSDDGSNGSSPPPGGGAANTSALPASVLDASIETAASDAGEEVTASTEGCAWIGFGIGSPTSPQCSDALHLLTHVGAECLQRGTATGAQQELVQGVCDLGSDEARVECCPLEGSDSLDWTPDAGLSALQFEIEASSADATRQDLVTEAAAVCSADGQQLGDWLAVYSSDGEHVERLLFQCNTISNGPL